MSEVGVEIIKAEEAKEGRTKYLNINVSNSEVERNPDIVRLCADAGILEYAKSKTGALDKMRAEIEKKYARAKQMSSVLQMNAYTDCLQIIDKYKAERNV